MAITPTHNLTVCIPIPLLDLIDEHHAKVAESQEPGIRVSRHSVILRLLYEGLKTTPQEVFGKKDTRPKLTPAEAKKLPLNKRY